MTMTNRYVHTNMCSLPKSFARAADGLKAVMGNIFAQAYRYFFVDLAA